jgi:2,5-dihydroxypyridine 5,6-dioxygenase
MAESLAVSYAATGELVPLFTRMLELCQVKPDEQVLLYTDSSTYPHYPAAFMGAALALGADVFQIVHPRGMPERAVAEAWLKADLVIELLPVLADYTSTTKDAQLAGTRILRVAQPEHVTRRLVPTLEMRKRVEAGADILEPGKTIRITSPNGTDLTLYKEGRDALRLYGIADKPGRWDIWPAGMVNCAPLEDRGEGRLVLSRGDHIKQLKRYINEPVYLEIQDGMITNIRGGLEADLLMEWFRKFKDPNAYRVSHIGWGCDVRADWLQQEQDIPVYYGVMEIAFGANRGVYVQGQTISKAHIDFCCRFNSFWVDNRQVLEAGDFLIEELKYKGPEEEEYFTS